MRILVAIPYEPERPAHWPMLARRLAERLPAANPGMTFDVALHPHPRTRMDGDGRFSANARARNSVLDTCLTAAHDYVLWADSDLLDYPEDLPSYFHTLNPDGISAPAVLLPPHIGRGRFYDILGFIEQGRGARMGPPWFAQEGPITDLESVGCCYLAPAQLYRDGARYADVPGYTEHMSVMRAAAEQGRRIICDTRLIATHAWLPDFGEAVH